MHKGRIEVLDSRPRRRPLRGHAAAAASPAAGAPAPRATERSLDRTMLDGVLEELRSPGAAAGARGRAAAPAALGRPRVLVVEDNPDMNRFVTQCLAAHYDVIVGVRRPRRAREGAAVPARARWSPTS